AVPQRVLVRQYAAVHAGAFAHEADGRAGARAGALARAHGAVSGPPAAALGPGRLSIDLRCAIRRATDGDGLNIQGRPPGPRRPHVDFRVAMGRARTRRQRPAVLYLSFRNTAMAFVWSCARSHAM